MNPSHPRAARYAARSALLALALFAAGCVRWGEGGAPPPKVARQAASPELGAEDALRQVPLRELPVLLDDVATAEAAAASDGSGRWASLRLALERHRRWLAGRPRDRLYTYGSRQVAARDLLAMADRLLSWLEDDLSPEALAVRVAHELEAWESVGDRSGPGGRGEMLVTGYYVPVIEASPRRTAEHAVPVYGPPRRGMIRVDLGLWDEKWKGRRISGLLEGGRLVPFPDRRRLREEGHMRGREIAWAKDPVDLFFVEVQGSGVLRYPDGREVRIGYAAQNGHPYRSIGKLLIDRGKVPRERMSMQAIRRYLAENPGELHEVLDYNPSVVFFRVLDGPPVGNLGVPVTAGRSVAVDQRLLPRGGFGFLLSDMVSAGPDGETVVEGELRRFVLAQDTGGAIRG
ncbi:MAG: MltA domain-containing protein, partial [Holophagales bacterium]|nr:MltA domain-containing protein [Holophagales bacterium]